MKTRKWYPARVIPDRKTGLIVMTDMGYYFEATYEKDGWHVSKEEGGKVYFPLYEHQWCIVKWMKV